jgi:hypothetical protein
MPYSKQASGILLGYSRQVSPKVTSNILFEAINTQGQLETSVDHPF